MVHEAVDPCAVLQFSLALAVRTGGTALCLQITFLLFLLQNLLAFSLQPRVTVIM